jgi:hypothetical protein
MLSEIEKWRINYEKKWGCSLTITAAPKPVQIDESKLSVCPLCEEPIYENQDSDIGVSDAMKTLIHSNCD